MSETESDTAHGALSPATKTASPIYWWLLGIVVLIATVLRVWSALDELWLDEIWTLVVFASKVRYPWDVFTFHHDNNHYLVTLWMYAVGTEQYSPLLYRLPSLAAGVGTVVLAALAARRWGTAAATLAAVLTGGSHFLIFFASQARGYALAGFFALTAFLALDRYLVSRSLKANALFVVAIILGMLSHLTFIEFYFAAGIWSLVVCWGYARSHFQAVRQLAALHAVPLAFFAILYLVDVRGLISSPDSFVLSEVLARTLTLGIGGITQVPLALFSGALLALAAGVAAIYLMSREESDLWIFFAAVIFFVPAVMISVLKPVVLYERFFYVNVLFFLLALSFLLSRLWQLGTWGRVGMGVALLLFLLGNLAHALAVIHWGRAHELAALQHIVENSAGPEIRVADMSANYRTQMFIKFYQPLLPPGRELIAEKLTQELPEASEWLLLDGVPNPTPVLTLADRKEAYRLSRVFPTATLEGPVLMAVYHRDDTAASEAEK
jgi:hypothetical protein